MLNQNRSILTLFMSLVWRHEHLLAIPNNPFESLLQCSHFLINILFEAILVLIKLEAILVLIKLEAILVLIKQTFQPCNVRDKVQTLNFRMQSQKFYNISWKPWRAITC